MAGRAWKFANDIDTDAIIPGRYLVINEPRELAEHLFEGVRPEMAGEVKEGDYVVAGENFGCGSSREHAPLALKGAGINAVVAKSFARIFFRNAINIGLAILECPAASDGIADGGNVDVDQPHQGVAAAAVPLGEVPVLDRAGDAVAHVVPRVRAGRSGCGRARSRAAAGPSRC